MMLQVYDNIFDDKYIFELNELCDKLPNIPHNVANSQTWPYGRVGTHNIMGATLFRKLSDYVYESGCPLQLMWAFDHFANKILKEPVELKEIYSNLQVMGMDGSSHTDTGGGSKTAILFTTYNWKKEWGGEFQTLDQQGNVTNTIDYVPGRILYFDADIPHRGLGPTIPGVYRHSIAYRIK
jgi:hypothetical protein